MRLKRIVAWVVGIGIFVWIGVTLYQNWTRIPFEDISINYYMLLLSGFAHAMAYLAAAFAWKHNIRMLGHHVDYRRSIEIMSLTRLGRYVPGKIWFAMGRAWFGKAENIPQRIVIVSIILETAVQFWAAVIVFIITGAYLVSTEVGIHPYIIIVLVATFILMHPTVFKSIINFGLKITKREKIEFDLSFSNILVLLAIYIVVFILHGAGFLFLTGSFYMVPITKYSIIIGTFGLAWIVGFLSFITPAGLGVREGALSFLLKYHLPATIGMIGALASRIWLTIIDIVFFLVFVRNLKRYV